MISRLSEEEDAFVFGEIVALLTDWKAGEATETLLDLFAEAKGVRAATLGTAIGRIAPEQLLDRVRARGRLDDEAFPAVATALAVAGGPAVAQYFDKALGRARMLNPERRRALYTAVLVSGDLKLCLRVLGDAVGDSNQEAPSGSIFPSRAAVASSVVSLLNTARLEAGEPLYEQTGQVLQEDAVSGLDPDQAKELNRALEARMVGDALRALAPLADLPLRDDADEDDDLARLPARRQGLLRALIERAKDIDRLEPAASTIFLTAAAQAAALVVSGGAPEKNSAGIQALSKALETDPEPLSNDSVETLSQRFEALTARQMRRVNTILVREPFRKAPTLQKLAEAVTRAGHGAGLISAAAESTDQTLRGLITMGMARTPEDAETAVLEVLDETQLEPQPAAMAMVLGERLRTERIALAVGRRFFELRQIEKALTAACSCIRATPDSFLSSKPGLTRRTRGDGLGHSIFVHGAPVEGRLADALERIDALRYGAPRQPLEVELECERCKEVGIYAFERAYVDPEAGADKWGDPAFVGDVICKACGLKIA